MLTLYPKMQGYMGKHEPGLLHCQVLRGSIPPFAVNPTGIEREFSIPAVHCVQGSVEVLKIIIIKKQFMLVQNLFPGRTHLQEPANHSQSGVLVNVEF